MSGVSKTCSERFAREDKKPMNTRNGQIQVQEINSRVTSNESFRCKRTTKTLKGRPFFGPVTAVSGERSA
jgi:hypothetical protein